MATTINLTVNGKAVVLKVDDPSMPLLYALRDQLGLHGMHFGCGLSQCGACTVHYYGEALRSCVMPGDFRHSLDCGHLQTDCQASSKACQSSD